MSKPESALTIREDRPEAMSPAELRTQVQLIQHIMREVMTDGEHYGVIPGTTKPTLYKSGAEKLGMTFRLDPRFDVTRHELSGGHREYEVRCHLVAQGGREWEGVGLCSTMESKYRYRGAEKISTGRPVPSEYWDLRKPDPQRAQELLGGARFTTMKDAESGQWFIAEKGERTENPDIADTYNTVLKMAKKRAHVDAILTATAASDIFTQDLEDAREATSSPKPESTIKEPKRKSEAKAATKPQATADAVGGTWVGTIAGVDERRGETVDAKTKKPKQWLLYIVKGADGTEFVTFSDSHADFAREAGDLPVRIDWEPSPKGGKKILEIGPATDGD